MSESLTRPDAPTRGNRSGPQDRLAFPVPRSCPFSPPEDYARLREHDPAPHVEISGGRPARLLTRYEDVRRFLADRTTSADARDEALPALGLGEREAAAKSRPFLRTDPPDHTRQRRILQAQFTVRRVARMADGIRERADHLVEALRPRGRADVVSDYANVVSTSTVLGLMGLPDDDPDFFREITRISGGRQSTEAEVTAALGTLFGTLDEHISLRSQEPGEDLLSALVQNHLLTGEVTRHELLSTVGITIIAGRETTTSMIALSTWKLLQDPAARAVAEAGGEAMKPLVEELLRLLSVADSIPIRVAGTDHEIAGSADPVRQGEGVISLLAAANHDPAAFPDPDRLFPDRTPNHHLAFGFGIHQCIGQHLARLELQVALHSLFAGLPGLELAGDDVALNNDAATFGIEELPVRW
ncbi:cytochrome P450 [Isoptericola halotolerans]|uniref:Cytochrome P450 n=1 Tax=Isoptericola halotolerans TaxID=300560 RepID=A0ABX2A778_9MICO|nr:cytochrome P450 [Isoptericola halotolerans]NOV98678.1 cytochrome P450 [Isoptericola halotolerans]